MPDSPQWKLALLSRQITEAVDEPLLNGIEHVRGEGTALLSVSGR